MDAIELIMKIWGIAEENRSEVETILKTTPPEHLGLALANLGMSADEAVRDTNDRWMETYLPELRFA